MPPSAPIEAAHQTIPPLTQASAAMRIALIVGDNHTRHCGVKDYAYSLAAALAGAGVHADVLAPASWSPGALMQFRRKLLAGRYDVVHMQYPSVGCRASLLPHALGLLCTAPAAVVTLHEHSALPASQRLSLHAFRYTNSALLLATEFERNSFNRGIGPRGAPQHIVPLGSNIPALPPSAGHDRTVVYFGQIRGHKGLETFLELARLCLARPGVDQDPAFRFRVLGSVTTANQAYAADLQRNAHPAVEWSFDLPPEEIASILNTSLAAYLPFPDGVSERRGSMLAAFANGLPVLSQPGPATTSSLSNLIVRVNSPSEARSALEVLASDPAARETISQASRLYAQRHDWHSIADQHAAIYRDLLSPHSDLLPTHR